MISQYISLEPLHIPFPFLLVPRCFTPGTIKTNKTTNKIRTTCNPLSRTTHHDCDANIIIFSSKSLSPLILCIGYELLTLLLSTGVDWVGLGIFFRFIFCGSWVAGLCRGLWDWKPFSPLKNPSLLVTSINYVLHAGLRMGCWFVGAGGSDQLSFCLRTTWLCWSSN